MLRGTNQEFGRPYNRRIVLETIRLKGPISRADIAREVSLSAQTVSNIIRELELAGFLASRREKPSRRGQPATMLEIDGRGGYALGLQLTPGSAAGLVVDLRGGEIVQAGCGLPADPDGIVNAVTGLVERLRGSAEGARLLGVGVAMPGPFDVEPMSHAGSTTIEALRGVPLRDLLAQRTGLPVFVGIDSGAAALGERQFGVGRSLSNFFYLFFSAGLGAATIAENALLAGAYGNAGEIGHLPLVPDGEPCPCGNRGCLERYVSIDALRRRFEAAGVDPDAETLEARALSRHPVVEAWVEEAVPLLERAIISVENLLDPRTIVIGGSLPASLVDRLMAALDPLPASVSQRSGRSEPRLMRSSLGPNAVLLGAAVLALNGVLSPRSGLLFEADGPGGLSDPMMIAVPPDASSFQTAP